MAFAVRVHQLREGAAGVCCAGVASGDVVAASRKAHRAVLAGGLHSGGSLLRAWDLDQLSGDCGWGHSEEQSLQLRALHDADYVLDLRRRCVVE